VSENEYVSACRVRCTVIALTRTRLNTLHTSTVFIKTCARREYTTVLMQAHTPLALGGSAHDHQVCHHLSAEENHSHDLCLGGVALQV
jgi:hypothetical protein